MKKHKHIIHHKHHKKEHVVDEKENKPSLNEVKKYQDILSELREEASKTVVGQEEIINGVLRGILSEGHVLLEGIPGIAKTLIIRTLSNITGGKYSRVQFTADLLPSDITGIISYKKEKETFVVVKGPIFANYVMADEINRSPPKCVLADTNILMANGSINTIENIFFNNQGSLALKQNNEEWYTPNEELKVMSFDPRDKKIKPKKVKYLYRQLANSPYYEVNLKSGRKIKTSDIHPFFSIKDGNVYNLAANELVMDDCVLIPKKIVLETGNTLNYNKEAMDEVIKAKEIIEKRKKLYHNVNNLKDKKINEIKEILNLKDDELRLAKYYLRRKPDYINIEFDENSFVVLPKKPANISKIKMPIAIDEKLVHFFALLISEGSQKDDTFYLSMKDKELVEYFITLLRDLFEIKTRFYVEKRDGKYRVALGSKALEKLLFAIGYKINSKSGTKDIPEFIMTASDENVKEFLKMYYEGDGGVSRDCVKVTSKSELVANKLSYLLLRFGLVPRISYEYSEDNNGVGGYYYNLRLYGNSIKEFKEKIGFISNTKNDKLKNCSKFMDAKKNDTIPFIHAKIRELRKRNNITHREFYEHTGMRAHNIENPNNRFTISREVLSLISKSLNGFEELNQVIEGDFYCDYVKSINVVYPEEDYYLYDFTIEDTHSFIAGFGGIISHNTQSSVLEAMQERQVTIGNDTYPLPKPFFVMATQNPIESSGVYPLPEAQIDRFLFKLQINYPKLEEESLILKKNITLKRFEEYGLKKITNPLEMIKMQDFTKRIYLGKDIENYIVRLIDASRSPSKYKISNGHYIDWGCSPRGSIGLYIGAKAEALLQGSNYVTPSHVKKIAYDVMRHRILLNYEGQAENIKTDEIIKEILQKVPTP